MVEYSVRLRAAALFFSVQDRLLMRVRARPQSPLDKCPVCFSDRYLNPALRLLVSKCYHKM